MVPPSIEAHLGGGWGAACKSIVVEGQHTSQTEGWGAAWDTVREAVRSKGPIDGILGFSQGAAVASVLAALEAGPPGGRLGIKFVIMASGFPSPAPEHVEIYSEAGARGIPLPNLHIFGGRRRSQNRDLRWDFDVFLAQYRDSLGF
mmetsp:Transcript_43233/g.138065  ORF Transcript_43233/g.138065 Transcript_43233/m.138065 type:complete len:146 (-) Transcript_43233:295-732(-)